MRYLLTLTLFLFFACNHTTPKKTESKKKARTTKKTSVKKKKGKKAKVVYTKLTDANVVAELTKYGKENPETVILIETTLGNMTVKLYNETPLHRANFLRLVKLGYYNETVFYRVIKGFVAQGGNSDNQKHYFRRADLGRYTIPSEFNSKYIHRKGALSMAREYEDNPDFCSSPYDYFFVHGETFANPELNGIKPEHCAMYKAFGGAPHLDGMHTVFGEITKGLDVLEQIAMAETDKGDWPKQDIMVKMTVIH